MFIFTADTLVMFCSWKKMQFDKSYLFGLQLMHVIHGEVLSLLSVLGVWSVSFPGQPMGVWLSITWQSGAVSELPMLQVPLNGMYVCLVMIRKQTSRSFLSAIRLQFTVLLLFTGWWVVKFLSHCREKLLTSRVDDKEIKNMASGVKIIFHCTSNAVN